MSTAIEVVIFCAKSEVSLEALQTAALAVTPILAQLPGFISREFGTSADNQFIDIVHWKNLECAQQAAEKVMSIPECNYFFGLIDQSKMQFMHFNKAE